jgi:hypothetical protein
VHQSLIGSCALCSYDGGSPGSRENQNTHFVFSNFFFPLESRAVDEIMWKNIVERDRPQLTIWRMRIACWIPKAKNTHSEYVILNPFPLH